ncbi:MAG: DnaA regulatory inactivator Hda [Luteimonas sp.]
MPLALRFPPDQRFETYVGGSRAALAQLHALAIMTQAGDAYLTGPVGVGKTHLALATCAHAEAAGRRATYLPLQAASGRLRDALDALDGGDLVALDGLDAIAGNRDDEVALFDFHNRARAAGISLLYAGRVAPVDLPLALPDLRSRLSQCIRIVLPTLDEEGRREVLRERARRRGLVFDDAALEWLLRRAGRDLAGLTRLLDRLDHASLAAQRRLTVPFLRETLGDLP